MKRLIILFFTVISTLSASIGEITAINGEAYILRDNVKIPAIKQTKLEEKDIIKTMPKSKLQIVFEDQTVISLGQNTTFEVEEYLFSQTKPKAKFKVSKGLFKSITGKIGKIAPQNFKLKTQNATIGVRGTTILGETTRDNDNIICSDGKIVVFTQLGQVAVDMGEQTTVLRGQKPTPAIKISTPQLHKMDAKIQPLVKPEKENVPDTVPTVKKEEAKEEVNEQPITVEVDEIKNQWGDWDKKDYIAQELENQPTPQPKTEEPEMLETLQALRDRAGTHNPTYSGKVTGVVNDTTISPNNNHIKLDVDLGRGTLNGDMAFEASNTQWNADIENGTVDQRGQIDFGLGNNANTMSGSGNGMLSGQNLQNADGSFHLKNESINEEAFGAFHADKD
ncbi:MAG: FecR family protein [Epsilonproteobacteria bacterium]|nr:FecR family protein [Campylobacterota bacterium]